MTRRLPIRTVAWLALAVVALVGSHPSAAGEPITQTCTYMLTQPCTFDIQGGQHAFMEGYDDVFESERVPAQFCWNDLGPCERFCVPGGLTVLGGGGRIEIGGLGVVVNRNPEFNCFGAEGHAKVTFT